MPDKWVPKQGCVWSWIVKQADVNSQYQETRIIYRDIMGLGEHKNGCTRSEQGFAQPSVVSVMLIWQGSILVVKGVFEMEPHY